MTESFTLKMAASITTLWISLIVGYFFDSPIIEGINGLQPIIVPSLTQIARDHKSCRPRHSFYRVVYALDSSSGADEDGESDQYLMSVVSRKLSWEISEAQTQKPVLNLSLRDASPEEARDDENADDVSEWDQGQRWMITVGYLSSLDIVTDDLDSNEPWLSPARSSSSLLKECPQLFRLEPRDIRETVEWIISEFGLAYIKKAVSQDKQSILLSFRKDDIAYGLEFMSIMMMGDAKPACGASSAFLLQAIQGGIQERTIGAALGAAGEATSKASRSIASDTMQSFRQLRDAKRRKK